MTSRGKVTQPRMNYYSSSLSHKKPRSICNLFPFSRIYHPLVKSTTFHACCDRTRPRLRKLHDREQKLGDTVDHKNIRTARETFHQYTIADKRKCIKYEVQKDSITLQSN